MIQLPEHVGPERQGPDAHDLTCDYTGATAGGPRCGQPATTHVRFTNDAGEMFGSAACDPHATYARSFGIVDEHPTAGSACLMPGSLWSYSNPSFCYIDDRGVEPALSGQRPLAGISA